LIRFYLDEMFSPVLVAAARARGLDITCSHDAGRDRLTDEEQLLAATSEGRCIVTENHRHFAPLADAFLDRGETYTGIILVPPTLSNGPVRAFVEALAHLAEIYPDGLPPNTVLWLNPPRR
jgi:hypothetical protein